MYNMKKGDHIEDLFDKQNNNIRNPETEEK